MNKERKAEKIFKGIPTMEGAGVKLKRVFGYYEKGLFDPFLLLDNFGSDDFNDYIAGFPWHPHRGIETVTYMIEGIVEHGDSMGNKGSINNGDVQWMTAGSGIIHQEMPKKYNGTMKGFQLWVNLPASEKMMQPRYRDVVASTIPEISISDGISAKIISGRIGNTTGPVKDLIADIGYFDVKMKQGAMFCHKIKDGYTAFCHVYEGSMIIGDKKIEENHLALLSKEGPINISTEGSGAKFILVFGEPINEPIAWGGPIVMNTSDELDLAFEEFHNGTFIK